MAYSHNNLDLSVTPSKKYEVAWLLRSKPMIIYKPRKGEHAENREGRVDKKIISKPHLPQIFQISRLAWLGVVRGVACSTSLQAE